MDDTQSRHRGIQGSPANVFYLMTGSQKDNSATATIAFETSDWTSSPWHAPPSLSSRHKGCQPTPTIVSNVTNTHDHQYDHITTTNNSMVKNYAQRLRQLGYNIHETREEADPLKAHQHTRLTHMT